MTASWQTYQEEAAAFFRSLGMNAETDARIQGVRTSHDIDVLVTSQHQGFAIRWLVECKLWQTAVSKVHVLALREIVADLGADRGILLAENGYQVGAREAAHFTNVQLTSLAVLRLEMESEVWARRVPELYDRVQSSRKRYWAMPKAYRIDSGLRPDSAGTGYMATHILDISDDLLTKAMRGIYPFESDPQSHVIYHGEHDGPLPVSYSSAKSVVEVVEPLLGELEMRLVAAENGYAPPKKT